MSPSTHLNNSNRHSARLRCHREQFKGRPFGSQCHSDHKPVLQTNTPIKCHEQRKCKKEDPESPPPWSQLRAAVCPRHLPTGQGHLHWFLQRGLWRSSDAKGRARPQHSHRHRVRMYRLWQGFPGWFTRVEYYKVWIQCIIDKSIKFKNEYAKVEAACAQLERVGRKQPDCEEVVANRTLRHENDREYHR